MRTPTLWLLLASVSVAGCTADTQNEAAPSDTAAGETAAPATAAPPTAAPDTPEGKIASAVAAAPAEISSQATVMDMDISGKMTELRAGTNGWLCAPDASVTPGPDPMCADKAAQEWLTAYFAKQPPKPSGMGIAYMLAGGSDASNTDPYATQPAPGDEWISSGPHIMVLPADPAQLAAFPTDPKNGGPFVMWKGTPYAHLMVPVEKSPR